MRCKLGWIPLWKKLLIYPEINVVVQCHQLSFLSYERMMIDLPLKRILKHGSTLLFSKFPLSGKSFESIPDESHWDNPFFIVHTSLRWYHQKLFKKSDLKNFGPFLVLPCEKFPVVFTYDFDSILWFNTGLSCLNNHIFMRIYKYSNS
jgi:hypothetical protein